jgi:hypothetical protein
MGRGIDSQHGKVYSSESIPWFLKRLQIQGQLGGGRGKAAPLKSKGFLHFPRSRGSEGERAHQMNRSTQKNGRSADSDSISDQWSKFRKIAKIFRKDLNQNIDQSPDIWSKPSKDRKFFANSGYWGRRQVAKNGFIEVFWCLVEICPPLAPYFAPQTDSHVSSDAFLWPSGASFPYVNYGVTTPKFIWAPVYRAGLLNSLWRLGTE